jgi:hypothetical protein
MPPTWPKSESCPSLHSFRPAPAAAGLGVLRRSRASCPPPGGPGSRTPNESVPLKPHTLVTMGHMRIASGKVVNGRVELDAELPEGTSVTVLALEGDEAFEVDAETEQMLLQAIAQCEKGQTTPMADLLSELRSRE